MEKRRCRGGFTLLEIMLTLIIVTVLASFAGSQYVIAIEKSRGAEARSLLGKLRTAQASYFLENRLFSNLISDLPVAGVPTACTQTHYYRYSLDNVQATASRCTVGEGGKTPDSSFYTIAITYDLGTWSCTPGWC